MRARAHWLELALLGLIVVVAAWLRLRQLGLMEFKADEALAVRIGRDIVHGDFRTVGLTSSAGAKNPPLFVYLAALPLLVWDDPRSPTAFVAVSAVVAVALLYFVLRRRFGGLAALTAAALLATAPWAVLYGRKLWAQDFLPVVTVGLLWSLFVQLERSRSRWVLLVPVLFSLAVQLNFSALALVVPVVLVVLYRRRHVHWPAFLIGVGVSLVLLGPWLAHNAKHHFTDFVSLAKEGRGNGGSSTPGEGLVEAVRQTVHLVSAEGWSFVMGASKKMFVDEAGAAWTLGRIAGIAVVVGLVAGIVSCAIRVVRRTSPDVDAARRALLLVWLLGIWLSYATSAQDRVQPHYLIASFPVSFALVGVGLSDAVALARGRRAALDRGGRRRRVHLGGVRRLHALVPPLPRPPRRHRRRLRRDLPRRAGTGEGCASPGFERRRRDDRVPRDRFAHAAAGRGSAQLRPAVQPAQGDVLPLYRPAPPLRRPRRVLPRARGARVRSRRPSFIAEAPGLATKPTFYRVRKRIVVETLGRGPSGRSAAVASGCPQAEVLSQRGRHASR